MHESHDTAAETEHHPMPEGRAGSSPPIPKSGDESRGRTRREFLGGGGKKALYLTPIILTLTARQARADSGMSGASG